MAAKPVRRRNRVRLRVEALEDRCLMDAGLGAAFDGSNLQLDPQDYSQTRILVRFQSEAQVFALEGTEVGEALPLVAGLHEVYLDAGMSVEAALAGYRGSVHVVSAEVDARFQLAAAFVPNDAGFGSQWGMHNTGQSSGRADADIDAAEAWGSFTGTGRVIVAVIDTGINYNHPDLAANMWVNTREIAGNGVDDDHNGYVDDIRGYDFANNDSDPMDDHGHGTHVAGIIGAVGNNGAGVAGVIWDVQIMALKFMDASGGGYTSDAIRALNYAVANGAIISNNSWGGGGYDGALYTAIQNARTKGHIFVAAAGNDGGNNDSLGQYPANYALDNVVSVAASDRNDNLASFSNYGATTVDLAAPGVSILSTTRNGSYGTMSGTSMAAPYVTGALALIRDAHPEWTYKQAIDQLFATVDPVAGLQGKVKTGGRLNLNTALAGISTVNNGFIRQLYQEVLGRAASSVEVNDWAKAMQNGLTRDGVARSIWSSFEHRLKQVGEFYTTVLDRTGSLSERTAWANAMLRGASENDVLRAFLTSTEYNASHSSNSSFIQGLYGDLLGRTADSAGLTAWVNALNGGRTRQAAVDAFLGSAERCTRVVSQLYSTYLRRTADAASLQMWSNMLQSGRMSYSAIAAAILSSQEYFNRAPQG